MRRFAKYTVAAAIAVSSVCPAHGNEISIVMNATVETRCEIVEIGQSPGGLAADLRVSVSCNAPQYQLGIVGDDGPLAVKVSAASAAIGTTSVVGNSMMVSPRRPGLHVFDLELPEGASNQNLLMVQLDGY